MEQAEIQQARVQAASIAAAVLAGEISPLLAAIDLNRMRSSVAVADDDADFDTFMAIDSECDGLPIGSVRSHWAPEALARKEPEIRRAERWAIDVGYNAFWSVVRRFAPAA